MTVEENRIAQLKALVIAAGAESGEPDPRRARRAGYRAVATAAGINEEYVYQLFKGIKKRMGPDVAKAIARAHAHGRDLSWFDQPIVTGNATLPALSLSGTMEQTLAPPTDAGSLGAMVQQIGRMSQRMTPMERASLVPVFQSVLTNPDSADEAAAMAEKIAPARKGPP